MFWRNVGLAGWGVGRDGSRELLLNTLPPNSPGFVFIASEGEERSRKGEAELGTWNFHSKGLI